MSVPPRILVCHCANAHVLADASREAALSALRDAGIPFESVADLCALSAKRDPMLKSIAGSERVVVAACHPRTVRWLFAAADAPLSKEGTQFLNLRAESPEALCAAIEGYGAYRTQETCSAQNAQPTADLPGQWNPWAPVIDYDRCTGCMQCLSFCLFGVYAVDADARIEVRNPQQCKTSCPACARVCPEAAILFPKHASDEINGGSTANQATREAMRVDLSALLGGDLYSRLRQRSSQPRFSKERDPDQALQERRKHLEALAQAGDIPTEVFNNLPPPEEIARRAAEAKAKAQAALDRKIQTG